MPTLPMSQGRPAHAGHGTDKQLTILLVEDNPAHAELIERCLEGHPAINKIYHVSDGKAALAFLLRQGGYTDERRSPRPHLILLDLRLPKVSGLDVLKEIKTNAALCDIPVVVLTTSEAETDIQEAYARHTNAYVVKPSEFKRLKQLMDELGAFWLAWNRQPLTMASTP